MNKFSFYIINFFAAAVAILLTAMFILIWQTSSIIFNLGGLPQVIENNLSNQVPGFNIQIDDINLSIGNIQTPFGIKANDINIEFKGENFSIKQTSIYFSPLNLLSGDFKIDKILVNGLNYSISHNSSVNGEFFKINKWLFPKLFKEILLNTNKTKEKNNLLNNLKNAEYTITNSTINLISPDQIKSVTNINLQIPRINNHFNILGNFNFDNIKEKIKFSFIKRKDSESDINLNFENIKYKEIDNFFVTSIDKLNFLVSGRISLKIDLNNKINNLNSSLEVSKISYPIEDNDLSNLHSKFQSGSFDLEYNFEEDQMIVENLLLSDGEFVIASGSANLRNLKGPLSSLKLDIEADKVNSEIIPKSFFKRYDLQPTEGDLSDINLKADILINREDFNYSIKNYKLIGFLNDFKIIQNDMNNKNIETLMNGSFELNNIKDTQTNLKLDLMLGSLSSKIILKDLIPKSYNLKLENGTFEDLSLKGNILIDNNNFDFSYRDFEIEGALSNLKVFSKNKKNFIETIINLKFLANLENKSIKNAKAKALVSDFTFFRDGMSKNLILDSSKFDLFFKDNKVKILKAKSTSSANSFFEGDASFHFSDEKEISEIDVHLKIDKINYTWLTSIWPNDFGVKTRDWIKSNVNGGFGENCNFNLALNFNENKIIKTLLLNWKHKNSKIKFYKDLPYAYLPEAYVNITEDEMKVSFLSSGIGSINVDKGELKIFPIFNKKARAKINLTGKSELKTVLNFLNEKDLNLLSKYKIGSSAEGKISYNSSFEWPIKKNIKKDEFTWIIGASGKNLNVYNLPLSLTHEISDFQLKADNKEFNLSTIGKVNDIQSKLNIIKGNKTNPEIKLDFDDSEELAILLSKFSQIKLYGKAKGFVEIKDFDFNNFNPKVVIDLSSATLEIPYINYIKEKGLSGLINSDLVFIDGKLNQLTNIQGQIGSVAFDGNIKFNNGLINDAKFNYITFPGTLISHFNLTQNKNDNFNLNINAEKINLMEYLDFYSNNKKEPNKNKYIFNIKSEEFLLPGGVLANGVIKGNYNFDNGFSAKLVGDVNINENIKINKIALLATQIDNEIILEGKGLINSTPIRISMESVKEKNLKVLTLEGNDAGKILNGLNITKLVEGGNIKMSVFLREQDYNNFDALIDVSKFNVTNAPILVRLISTLSLTGLLNLLEENGIYFERGLAKINNFNNKLNIENIEAVGEAMAISLKGWINNEKDILQVQGTIAPATLLTKLLEPIPVLNDLLIGGDKAGVVLTEFRLDGSTQKPSISFRPLSSAPGLLRDIFNLFRSDQADQNKSISQN